MAEPLKNIFFTEAVIKTLAGALKKAWGDFDERAFLSAVFDRTWKKRELKQRLRHITLCMRAALPADYARALAILEEAAPALQGFDGLVFPDYVELYGRGDWSRSLKTLRKFTRYSSAEFAIRPFLVEDQARALKFLEQCARDNNFHVRRFASEGCRPRLPWAMALPVLKKDPAPLLPILELLKDDPEEYVRRSVANNLNDIARDHPGITLELCERWSGSSARTDAIVKHALRGLLKKGDRRAMALFGFRASAGLRIEQIKSPSRAKIGAKISFSFDLALAKAARVRLEYGVYYYKKRGESGRKVFQITETDLERGRHHFEKKHSFEDRTTRKHYPGPQRFVLIVNGIEKESWNVRLL